MKAGKPRSTGRFSDGAGHVAALLMKRSTIRAALLCLICLALSLSYYSHFADALQVGVWQDVDGYTRIVIPDTLLYQALSEGNSVRTTLVIAAVKNSVGPTAIWYITGNSWIGVAVVNAVLLFAALWFVWGISGELSFRRRNRRLALLIVALLPDTIFYSVGALKEIPNMTFLLGFFYFYISRKRIKSTLLAFMCVAFRFQLVLPIAAFIFVDLVTANRLKSGLVFLAMACMVYPFIGRLAIFASSTTELYRQTYGVADSLGGAVESIRNNVPVVSLLAIAFRVVQNIFESLIEFSRSITFREHGSLSVTVMADFFSGLIMLPFWLKFFRKTGTLLRSRRPDRNVDRLFLLCAVFVVPVGGFSFIHGRYLYPVLCFIILGALSEIEKRAAQKPALRAVGALA